MHKLSRQVRFSINPFGPNPRGYNSFASDPPGEGLALYFALWVEVWGSLDADTGFVINVTEIDKAVRGRVVGDFSKFLQERFWDAERISFADLAKFLRGAGEKLAATLGGQAVKGLTLELSPFRKLSIDTGQVNEMYISEKFEFAATHTLWNSKFSEEKNFEMFGKCANPTGHGHNYVIEVVLKAGVEEQWPGMGAVEKIIDENFISLVDHKNLNADVPQFKELNPTVENIAVVAWRKLAPALPAGMLEKVNVWETDKTYCSYDGR